MAKKPQNIALKILESHLVGGAMTAGQEIQLKVDQLLMQDALSALTMLALEAMELDRIKIDLACQYVDHNLFQADYRNPDDHLSSVPAAAVSAYITVRQATVFPTRHTKNGLAFPANFWSAPTATRLLPALSE